MAPSILSEQPTAPHLLSERDNNNAPRSIFPDGIRTSGQLEPEYQDLQPYDAFPKEITGPTVWSPEEYQHSPEKWVHRFTPVQVAELGATADSFIKQGIPLTGISQVCRMILCMKFQGLTGFVEQLSLAEPVKALTRPT